MKKTIFILLLGLSCLVLSFRFTSFSLGQVLNNQNRSGLKVLSTPSAAVILNGQEVGKTPYQNENLNGGQYHIELKTEGSFWQGMIELNPGTISVIERDLAVNNASSSGEVLSLEKGKGVMIVSYPSEATVEMDNHLAGKTPLSITDLAPGEHTFVLSRTNFLQRKIQVLLPENLSLNLSVDLALAPKEKDNLAKSPLTASFVPQEEKLVVGKTPGGFLRVREKPTISSREIARIFTGQTLTSLRKLSDWYEVKLDNGARGYVASVYVQSLN